MAGVFYQGEKMDERPIDQVKALIEELSGQSEKAASGHPLDHFLCCLSSTLIKSYEERSKTGCTVPIRIGR